MLLHGSPTFHSLHCSFFLVVCPQESYLDDVYDFYMKHLEEEAETVDWK